jgi:MoxR-like ATPase
MFHKGDKKEQVNERLIKALLAEVKEMKSSLVNSQRSISQKSKNFLSRLNTPFVSEEDTKCAIKGFNDQRESLELKIKDCDRLESLCS